MTKRVGEVEESVTRIELDNAVSAGIRLGSLGDDMVPLFEEHAARLERGISMKDWYALEPLERAMVVAIRRLDNSMKNLQAEAEIRKAKRDAKLNSRK